MFVRYVGESFRRAPRRKAMTVAAVAMGTAVAVSMLGVMLDIGDKVNVELRSMGANILVVPTGRASVIDVDGATALPAGSDTFIQESRVPKIKAIFWALNITGFAPSLTVPTRLNGSEVPIRGVWFDHKYVGEQRAGVRLMNPSWKVTGHWPEEGGPANEALAGARLHLASGTTVQLFGKPFTITGVLNSGADEDGELLVRLADLQPLVHREGLVDAIQVAALTKPEDDFARKDPSKMTDADRERWNCSNYVRSIAHEIEEVIPGTTAKPVWRVADGEGRVLSKITGLMSLIALAALIAAGLTVWSVMATTVMERRGEIAIMQATGATDFLISSLFAAEVALEGFAGGVIGVLIGLQLARWVGHSVFGSGTEAPMILAPLAILLAVVVAVAGALPPASPFTGHAASFRIAGARLMFWRFVMGAVKLRRRRLFLAFCAMAVAGALATALFTVYSDVEKKLSQQFQAYGANVTIGAANGETTVPLRAADEVRRLGGTAAPFVIALSTLNGRPVILEGVDLGLAGNLLQYWHIEGRRGNCLAGISLGLKIGETVQLRNFSCTVDGIVSTGASEDNRIILPFATVAHLSGLDTSTGSAAASVIQARLPVDKVEALAKAVPQADVRLVQAVAETESNVPLSRGPGLRFQVGHGLDARHAQPTSTNDPVNRKYHHNQLTFRGLYACSTESFVLPLSHDEVVYGKGLAPEQDAW